MKKSNYSVTPLFPIPFYQTNLGYVPKDIEDAIINLEYERTPGDNNFYSKNKYVLEIPELRILKNKIMTHVEFFIYDFLDVKSNMQFVIENSWTNKHHKYDASPEHFHGNSLISGVYYPITDQSAGSVIFYKDKTHYNLWTDTIRVDFNWQDNKTKPINFFNTQSIEFKPQPNDLILFPSLLNHEVTENTSSLIRYSLAFNIFPRGEAGGPINRLKV